MHYGFPAIPQISSTATLQYLYNEVSSCDIHSTWDETSDSLSYMPSKQVMHVLRDGMKKKTYVVNWATITTMIDSYVITVIREKRWIEKHNSRSIWYIIWLSYYIKVNYCRDLMGYTYNIVMEFKEHKLRNDFKTKIQHFKINTIILFSCLFFLNENVAMQPNASKFPFVSITFSFGYFFSLHIHIFLQHLQII